MPPPAVFGDTVTASDVHIIMIPTPGGPVPTPVPHPFVGKITQGCSTNVQIGGKFAAIVGAVALCVPPHIPQGGPFQAPPPNKGDCTLGSQTVMINGKGAVRAGPDLVTTCDDVAPVPKGAIAPSITNVMIG